MADRLYFLSENDIKVLQKVLDESRSRNEYSPARIPTELALADRQDFMSGEIYIAKPAASSGIPGLTVDSDGDIPGKAICDIYRVTEPVGEDTYTRLLQMEDKDKYVYNLAGAKIGQGWIVTVKAKSGHWIAIPTTIGETVGGQLTGQHPGPGIAFTIYLGVWNPSTVQWDYDVTTVVNAIDWRYGVTYPASATGLFTSRASDFYGTIWEVVSLDCEGPGTGTGS